MKHQLAQIALFAATLPHLILAVECDVVAIDGPTAAEAVRKACPTITHDVTLTSRATSDIVLDGVEQIGGSLRVEGGSGVTNLSSTTLKEIGGNLTIQNVAHLRAVYLPELRTVGQRAPDSTFNGSRIILEDLPELTEVRLDSIRSVGEFRAIKLPKWEEITSDWFLFWVVSNETEGRRGVFEIRDVGLVDLKPLGAISSGSERRGETHINEITISGIPNVRDLRLEFNRTKALSIEGNGNLSVSQLPRYIDEADIAGVRSLPVPIAAKLRTRHNTFETLKSPFMSITDLTIEDNANFTGFSNVGRSWIEWTAGNYGGTFLSYLTSIQLRRVPALDLAPNLPPLGGDVTSVDGSWLAETYCEHGITAGVCMRNMSTVVIEGNVSNGFFDDFLVAFWNKNGRGFWAEDEEIKRDIHKHGRVLDRFEVNSTDKDFNCTRMHELRDVGLFAGEYSCNGESVPITRDAWASTAANLRPSAVILVAVLSIYAWILV